MLVCRARTKITRRLEGSMTCVLYDSAIGRMALLVVCFAFSRKRLFKEAILFPLRCRQSKHKKRFFRCSNHHSEYPFVTRCFCTHNNFCSFKRGMGLAPSFGRNVVGKKSCTLNAKDIAKSGYPSVCHVTTSILLPYANFVRIRWVFPLAPDFGQTFVRKMFTLTAKYTARASNNYPAVVCSFSLHARSRPTVFCIFTSVHSPCLRTKQSVTFCFFAAHFCCLVPPNYRISIS